MYGEGVFGLEVPSHVSVWPSQEETKLYLVIPPLVWREATVRPFQVSDQRKLEHWTFQVTEFYHHGAPQRWQWPEELNRPVELIATDIPSPPESPLPGPPE
jgi:hypothetical protein